MNQTNIWSPDGGVMASTGIPVAPIIAVEYPEVAQTLRINTPGVSVIRNPESSSEYRSFYEESILAVDSNFFSFFGFELAKGDPRTALKGKNKVVLSKGAAERLFGDEPALGKMVLYGEDQTALEVTGISNEQPLNSHFHFDYLLSMSTNPNIERFEWSWIWTQMVTYVKLHEGVDVAALEQKLKDLPQRFAGSTFERLGTSYVDFVKYGSWELFLQPVRAIHLNSVSIGNRLGPVSDIRYMYIFATTGLLVLLIAGINYVNLTTAKATSRAKEIGVKKVLGVSRPSLVLQIISESIVLVLVAAILGWLLMQCFHWVMRQWLEFNIPFILIDDGLIYWGMPLLVLLVGVLAGTYPALYTSALKPSNILKKTARSNSGALNIRHGLVTFQFMIAIILLVSTMVVYSQLQYFSQKDLGFNHENILIIDHAEKLEHHLETYQEEILAYPGVVNASVSFDLPGRGTYEDLFIKEGGAQQIPISQLKIDGNFFETLNLRLISGQNFNASGDGDNSKVIINETAAGLFGWTPEQAVGERIIYTGDDIGPLEVKGVVEDFHFESLRFSIRPLIFLNSKAPIWGDRRVLAIKYSSSELGHLLDMLASNWRKMAGNAPFDYSFYQQEWKQIYESENRLGRLFSIFTALSIIVAIIGLVGLVSYSVEQRKKEIGIRKVLGAGAAKIVLMMNYNYVKLIIIALLIACPTAWIALDAWLSVYAYRVSISPWLFLVAGGTTCILALSSVGYLSLRAALVNPTEVLKDE